MNLVKIDRFGFESVSTARRRDDLCHRHGYGKNLVAIIGLARLGPFVADSWSREVTNVPSIFSERPRP